MKTNLSAHQPNIMVIESDPEARSLLRTSLSAEHYCLREVATAVGGLEQVEACQPDVILLDPELPDMDGVEVIRHLRFRKYAFPIIVLSNQANEQDKVIALDAGADDFVEKPFAAAELLARLRAALRRVKPVSSSTDSGMFRVGNIEADFEKRQVRVSGRAVHLTPIEYNLFRIFTQHPNLVLTYRHLIREIWGSNQDKHLRSLRVYIGQLRRKLAAGSHLRTESTIGYRFQTE